MAAGRFAGDGLVLRLGPVRVVRGGGGAGWVVVALLGGRIQPTTAVPGTGSSPVAKAVMDLQDDAPRARCGVMAWGAGPMLLEIAAAHAARPGVVT